MRGGMTAGARRCAVLALAGITTVSLAQSPAATAPARRPAASAAAPAPNAQAPASTVAGAADDAGTVQPSRWAADLERIDEDVRLRLLTPNDPRGNYIRGALDKTDIASQVAHLAVARSTAPQEKLYLAALAAACLTPTQPTLPDCDAVDRLADWARRDEDNGVPAILLANRARQHGETDAMVAHLAEAAEKPRFDEYWGRGVLAFWDYFRAAPLPFDPAAKAVAALTYATEQPVPWPTAMQAMCATGRDRASDALRSACANLGNALAARASTWAGRLTGVAVALRNTPDPAAQSRIEASRTDSNGLRARCDDARRSHFDGLESPDAAVRTRELAAADAWVRAQADAGEIGACERLMRAR